MRPAFGPSCNGEYSHLEVRSPRPAADVSLFRDRLNLRTNSLPKSSANVITLNTLVKQRELLFRVDDTDVSPLFQVLWKARNNGEEAKRLGQLRGETHRNDGRQQRKERTLYSGHHWMECYIVKDSVCVARAHESVIIA